MIQIKVSPEMGRGVYASQRVDANTVLAVCELIALNAIDTIKVNSTALKYYTFNFLGPCDCLVLGIGELFNHDDKPNVSYKIEPFEDRWVMVFRTLEPVDAGSQFFIDYAADTKVDVGSYVEQPSLVTQNDNEIR